MGRAREDERDITIGATLPMIGAASTPNEIESTRAATA